jgi:NTP pyrophosphatase (non-canonical NTP hydrolase)
VIEKYLDKAHRAFFDAGIDEIGKHYGAQSQLIKLGEECAEFDQALLKCVQGQPQEHVLEEFADVLVVSEQVLRMLDPESRKRVLEIVLFKIKRQIDRINAEKSHETH